MDEWMSGIGIVQLCFIVAYLWYTDDDSGQMPPAMAPTLSKRTYGETGVSQDSGFEESPSACETESVLMLPGSWGGPLTGDRGTVGDSKHK